MKNRGIVVVLALFLGGFGIQKYYLGQIKTGLICSLFFWTLIPALIAIFDAFRFAFMSEAKFQARYNNVVQSTHGS